MLEEDAIKKGIEIEKLKEEQKKLSKLVSSEDKIDFSLANRFGGIDIQGLKDNKLIVAISILNENNEIIEEKYTIKKPRFPYIPGLRAYRELQIILDAYNKLEENADVFFIESQGLTHIRGLGLASHLGLSINKPVIAISTEISDDGLKKEKDFILKNNKKIAQKLITKEGSNPIYVGIGHNISLKSAIELTKKLIVFPHKLPEPIILARKFAKKTKKEIELE